MPIKLKVKMICELFDIIDTKIYSLFDGRVSAIFALWDCIINVKIKVSYIGEYFYVERKIRGFCSYMINLPLNVFELKFGINFVDLVQWLQIRNVWL